MAQQYLGSVPLYPRSHYVAELRAEIPESAYAPSRSRMLLSPLYLAVVVLGICAIGLGWAPWPVWPLISIAIGIAFASQTFIAHESLHGGITKSKLFQTVQGYLGFAPFLLAPRIWVAWHNQTHHAITNQPGDPDAFPTIEEYKTQAGARFAVDKFAVGPNRLRGFWTMAFGFTIQSAHQTHSIKKFKYASGGVAVLAIVETLLMVGLWVGLLVVLGFVPWLFAVLIPMMVANAITIAFILTNHSLSPFIPINDPLITGLSVTVPKIVDLLTLNFGFHTEHHLFPAMSSRHARLIRKLCLEHWPERYQAMPMGTALLEINRTARVYKDAVTLYDPDTGREWSAILPRERAQAAVEPAA
ncbi:MAG: fatty acid desaturase [Kofleriaceae bacterium]